MKKQVLLNATDWRKLFLTVRPETKIIDLMPEIKWYVPLNRPKEGKYER